MNIRISFLLLAAFIFSYPISAPAKVWLFGAAACPGWKAIPGDPELTEKMHGACQKDIDLFVTGMRAVFDIADDTVVTLVDEQATGPSVAAALGDLAKRVKPEDTVILYVNTHGGKIEAMYKGYAAEDEVFAFYTKTRPQDVKQATANNTWMTARVFRDLVNKLPAEKIVLIIEACHAEVAKADFFNNVPDGIGGRGVDWPGREAVIFSALPEQIANFTEDNTEALFTRKLSDELRSATHSSLLSAFDTARLKTHRAARAHCAKGHTHKELIQGWSNYRTMCTQMPSVWDPFGLLDDLQLKSHQYRYE